MLLGTSRREFLQIALATAAITGASSAGRWARLMAQQAMTQDDILAFEPLGNVTLTHVTDIHAQLKPVYFREPSVNLGVGAVSGLPPHITGEEFLSTFGIAPGSAQAYALSSVDFASLAKAYGRMGGLDRVATLVKAIRAERPDNTLFFDGGDTWQGSYTAYKTNGQDMVDVMTALGTDAMTAHWEFTLGAERVREIVETMPFPFLCGNVRDTEWDEAAFESTAYFDKGGVKIAVIGQAFPYTPVANPRWMIPSWSFGIREDDVQANVDKARSEGAELVVLLSHNGFDVDRKLASRVKGIDVVLTGHTHDALPEPVMVGKTILVATGSNGKFVSRIDLDVQGGEVKDFRHKLMPVFSDVIEPDPEIAAIIDKHRAPYENELKRVLGTSESTLYRRGNFNGTFDDLICDALIAERDAEIALSPGFRWGTSLIPGQDITVEDIHTQTSMSYPEAYRSEMSGALLKDILEDVADNLFNIDPYYQQGGDMVRVGGLGYTIDPTKAIGSRISDMTMLKSGAAIDAAKNYTVAGWASVNEGTQGPPIWDVLETHIKKTGSVKLEPNRSVKVVGI